MQSVAHRKLTGEEQSPTTRDDKPLELGNQTQDKIWGSEERDYSITELRKLISECSSRELDETAQRQLGEIVEILHTIKEDNFFANYSSERYRACFVIRQIILNSGNYLLTEKVIAGLRRPILRLNPSLKVFAGLGLFIYLVSFIMVIPLSGLQGDPTLHTPSLEEVLEININLMFIAALFGALGSVVSMMIRINDFQYLKDADPYIPFLIGMFKPIIGASFALFILSAIESGIIEFNIAEGKVYFVLALSFVSGFSERFARDVIARVEGPEASPTRLKPGYPPGADKPGS